MVCALAGEEVRTRVARSSLDPVFNARLRLRLPAPAPADAAETPPCASATQAPALVVSVLHTDLREQLRPLCAACEAERAEPGGVLVRGGAGAGRLLILDSGTVGVFEDDDSDPPPPAGGGGAAAGMREVARVSRRGACFGEAGALTGAAHPLTIVALTPAAVVAVPADALGALLVRRRRLKRIGARRVGGWVARASSLLVSFPHAFNGHGNVFSWPW